MELWQLTAAMGADDVERRSAEEQEATGNKPGASPKRSSKTSSIIERRMRHARGEGPKPEPEMPNMAQLGPLMSGLAKG